MASKPIHIRPLTLVAVSGWVVGVELLAGWWLQWSAGVPLYTLAFARLAQSAGLLWWVMRMEGGLHAIGWAPRDWVAGLRQGGLWAVVLALVAGGGLLLLHAWGHQPLAMIHHPMPAGCWDRTLFFLVGGAIGPLAEELFFRGVLYTFLRRWGVVVALIVSTAIFVALHAVHGIPYTQITGGLVFALAFEKSRNLMVPITIHAAGNVTIFILSLLAG